MRQKLIHFSWMGAYWSTTQERFEAIQRAIADGLPFDLYDEPFRSRELRSKPAVDYIYTLNDVELRASE